MNLVSPVNPVKLRAATLLLHEDYPDVESVAQKEIDEQATLGVGMKEKGEEFVAAGGGKFIDPVIRRRITL